MTARARNATLRNLILIQIESFELPFIGHFNPRYPKSMPYLSEIARNRAVFSGLVSQPYTGWTAAGLFVTQCGFPQLLPNVVYFQRFNARITAFNTLHCLSDFLQAVGYHLLGFGVGSWALMRMKWFMRQHGYDFRDEAEHHTEGDHGLFEMLERDVLPTLADKRHWPFVLMIGNEDTHVPYAIRKECDDYLAGEGYPQVHRSFTCLDQKLRKLLTKIQELKLDENSEVFIYGDHLSMRAGDLDLGAERNLTVVMPFREQDEKWKKAIRKSAFSYYDFAPTVLELLGIDYWPPFPFGADFFGEAVGDVPSEDDMRFIYSLATGDAKGESIKCVSSSGLCKGDVGDRG
jgi:phosphoglycerol transferase MdoB-like AlkP superfamily enzyme